MHVAAGARVRDFTDIPQVDTHGDQFVHWPSVHGFTGIFCVCFISVKFPLHEVRTHPLGGAMIVRWRTVRSAPTFGAQSLQGEKVQVPFEVSHSFTSSRVALHGFPPFF
jgi:hypothetical protein